MRCKACRSYLFSQVASTVGCIENFIIENGKVQSKAQTNGVCWLHLILGNVKCIVVRTLRFFDDFYERERVGVQQSLRAPGRWTYFDVHHLWQLQPNSDSNRPSSSNRKLSIRLLLLLEWGICPIKSRMIKDRCRSSSSSLGPDFSTYQNFLANVFQFLLDLFSVFFGHLLFAFRTFGLLFDAGGYSPWGTTSTNNVLVGNRE